MAYRRCVRCKGLTDEKRAKRLRDQDDRYVFLCLWCFDTPLTEGTEDRPAAFCGIPVGLKEGVKK